MGPAAGLGYDDGMKTMIVALAVFGAAHAAADDFDWNKDLLSQAAVPAPKRRELPESGSPGCRLHFELDALAVTLIVEPDDGSARREIRFVPQGCRVVERDPILEGPETPASEIRMYKAETAPGLTLEAITGYYNTAGWPHPDVPNPQVGISLCHEGNCWPADGQEMGFPLSDFLRGKAVDERRAVVVQAEPNVLAVKGRISFRVDSAASGPCAENAALDRSAIEMAFAPEDGSEAMRMRFVPEYCRVHNRTSDGDPVEPAHAVRKFAGDRGFDLWVETEQGTSKTEVYLLQRVEGGGFLTSGRLGELSASALLSGTADLGAVEVKEFGVHDRVRRGKAVLTVSPL